jgi:hypothetical protein
VKVRRASLVQEEPPGVEAAFECYPDPVRTLPFEPRGGRVDTGDRDRTAVHIVDEDEDRRLPLKHIKKGAGGSGRKAFTGKETDQDIFMGKEPFHGGPELLLANPDIIFVIPSLRNPVFREIRAEYLTNPVSTGLCRYHENLNSVRI